MGFREAAFLVLYGFYLLAYFGMLMRSVERRFSL